MSDHIDIVFDGPPSHESGRFVEVEDANQHSISIGDWIEDNDLWRLRIPDPRRCAELEAERDTLREALRLGVDLTNHHNAAWCPYCRAEIAGVVRKALEPPAAGNVDAALSLIRTELARAEAKFPTFPVDAIHAAAIVNEEAGELVQAALQYTYEGGSHEHMVKEAVQTATMGVRFILNAGTLVSRPSEQVQRAAEPPAAGGETGDTP